MLLDLEQKRKRFNFRIASAGKSRSHSCNILWLIFFPAFSKEPGMFCHLEPQEEVWLTLQTAVHVYKAYWSIKNYLLALRQFDLSKYQKGRRGLRGEMILLMSWVYNQGEWWILKFDALWEVGDAGEVKVWSGAMRRFDENGKKLFCRHANIFLFMKAVAYHSNCTWDHQVNMRCARCKLRFEAILKWKCSWNESDVKYKKLTCHWTLSWFILKEKTRIPNILIDLPSWSTHIQFFFSPRLPKIIPYLLEILL